MIRRFRLFEICSVLPGTLYYVLEYTWADRYQLMLTEIVVIAALILANGLFSMSEMAVISARKSRLKAAADAGDAGARCTRPC
jgi:hypothetical protein